MDIVVTHIRRVSHVTITRLLRTNAGELRRVPNHVLALVLFLCLSVLLQGIADIVLEVLIYTDALPYLPLRSDFLFLTAISVLMGYRTLTGMLRQKFDVTRNSIELGLLVEIGLIIGDSLFIRAYLVQQPFVLSMRLPFIVLTSINVVILGYTYYTLKLSRWWNKQI